MVFEGHSSERRATIAIRPGRALRERPRLFSVLESAHPVSFVPFDGELPTAAAPTIVFAAAGEPTPVTELAEAGEPILVVGEEDSGDAPRPARLAAEDGVDVRLRGAEL